MNKTLLYVAFVFFSLGWIFNIGYLVFDIPEKSIFGFMNVGLMWLTLAAIQGKD